MRDADGRRAPTGRRRSTGASGGRRAYVPLCRPADEPRQQGAPGERQRDRHTQARGGQAELAQVDGERDPEKAVAERPHGLRDEDRSDLRLTNSRHVLSISAGGGVPMNPVERVLYRELAELL